MSDTEQIQEVATETTEVVESTATESQNTEQPSGPSAIEQKAIEMGWRPKEEFGGDEDDFIDATEFVRRKPLFDKIEHQSKELKEIKRVLRSLQDHHVKVKEVEFKRAVDYLKAQKKEALEVGDHDKVVELDDQLVDLRAAQRAQEIEQATPSQPTVHPDFSAWVQKNTWYAQDEDLRAFADKVGLDYNKANPELPPVEVLKYVSARVKKVFPHKFSNTERTKPAAVDGGSSTAKPTKASDNFSMTEEEERVMKTFVRAGIMTEADYKKELKAMRG